MEDLWKVRDIGYRWCEWAERAEYARLLRAFREEERKDNSREIFFGGIPLAEIDTP